MNPRSLDTLVLLSGFVRPFPIAFGVKPQSGKRLRESGWRLSRGEGLAKFVQGHSENTHCQFPYCELPNQNSATQEATVEEPAKKTSVNAEAIEQQSIMLTVQVLWACHAWNTTPEEAAKQVVADLYEHLSCGGSVQVQIADLDGREHTLEVTTRR